MKEKPNLGILLKTLDRDSRILLYNLWYRNHLNISQLRELIGAQNDFVILDKLKNTINKFSLKIFGKPLVAFRKCYKDPDSGEKIFFNWWFLDEMEFSDGKKPLMDFFEERDNVVIITQLKSAVDITKVELNIKNDILEIKIKKV